MKRAKNDGKGEKGEKSPPSPFPSSPARFMFSLPGPRPARRPKAQRRRELSISTLVVAMLSPVSRSLPNRLLLGFSL